MTNSDFDMKYMKVINVSLHPFPVAMKVYFVDCDQEYYKENGNLNQEPCDYK